MRRTTGGSRNTAIGSACFVCDVDDDGWLDIVQLTYSRTADYVHTLRTGEGPPGGSPLRVFRNNRDGTFTEIAEERVELETLGAEITPSATRMLLAAPVPMATPTFA